MKLQSPFGRDRRQRDLLRIALLRGEQVTVHCRLRRTSARGWGPWTDALVTLEAGTTGAVTWHADDPIAVGLPSTRGPVDATFTEIKHVWTRTARFRAEAFWGMEDTIVVLTAERATTELAVHPELAASLFERVREQLGPDPPA